MSSRAQRVYEKIEKLGAVRFILLFKAFVQKFDSNLTLITGATFVLYGALLQHNDFGPMDPVKSSVPCEVMCAPFEIAIGSLFLLLFVICTTQSLLNQTHVRRDANNRLLHVENNVALDHLLAVVSFLIRLAIGSMLVVLIVRFSSNQTGFSECRFDHAYNNIKFLISIGLLVFASSFITNAVFGKYYGVNKVEVKKSNINSAADVRREEFYTTKKH